MKRFVIVALLAVTFQVQAEPQQDRFTHDACFSACSNLRVMFICKEGGNFKDFEPCLSVCRAGRAPWSVECARKARTFDDVHRCGIKC